MADLTDKRHTIAAKGVLAATQLVDALNQLLALKDERTQAGNFVDADFTGTNLKHLDAATIGTLFDFVVPSLLDNYTDAANGNRNKNILLAVR